MRVAFSLGETRAMSRLCDECGSEYNVAEGFVLHNGVPCAVYYAGCHTRSTHDRDRNALRVVNIDVILGARGAAEYFAHLTFSAEVNAFNLGFVDGPTVTKDDPALLGAILSERAAWENPHHDLGVELCFWLREHDPTIVTWLDTDPFLPTVRSRSTWDGRSPLPTAWRRIGGLLQRKANEAELAEFAALLKRLDEARTQEERLAIQEQLQALVQRTADRDDTE
jgi:hypothetical protein